MRSAIMCVVLLGGVILASCAGGPATTPTAIPSTATPMQDEARPAVDAAVQDAAAHLSIGTGEVHVVRVEARDWSDTSLGCPQPGMLYSQVVTPGFLVVLSGAGKQLEYHSDSRGRVALCQES